MPLKEMEDGGLQESGWTMVWRTLQFAMQWLQSVERVVVVILCSDVSAICFTIHFMP